MAGVSSGIAQRHLMQAIAVVRALPPRAAFAHEMRRIRRAEVHGSTALAGSTLDAHEIDALLDHDRAAGNHRFVEYAMVRAYADAARLIGDARSFPTGDRRPLLTVDELRQLHARAVSGSPIRGGLWRQGNPPPAAGIVAPAAWLVAREVTALLDRSARGVHDSSLGLWLATFLGRFARLRPFEGANGRTARLAANLMLRRLDIVPAVLERSHRARYAAALAAAETNAPDALAAILDDALLRVCRRLAAAGTFVDDALLPLREIAGRDYTALAKAAQRGRLRTIVRGGRYFTTPQWVADYQLTRRSPPVRPPIAADL